MILSDGLWLLSPAYDLLNVKIVIPADKDDFALLLGGKKKRQTRAYFEDFGKRLGLNTMQIRSVLKRLLKIETKSVELINKSFLSEELKLAYFNTISSQVERLKELT